MLQTIAPNIYYDSPWVKLHCTAVKWSFKSPITKKIPPNHQQTPEPLLKQGFVPHSHFFMLLATKRNRQDNNSRDQKQVSSYFLHVFLLVLQGFHMNDQKVNQPKFINPEVP
jgi:hypothetical protein